MVNSCQFGVPQNRERIFIVGHLTEAGGRVGEVLPVGRSDAEANFRIRQVAHRKGYNNNTRTYHPDGISGTIDTSEGSGLELHIAESLQGNDYANTIRSGGKQSKTLKHNWDYVKIKKTGEPKNNQDIAACLTGGGNSGGNHSDMDLLKVKAVLTPDRLEKRQNGRRFKEHEEPSFTLTSQDKHGGKVGTQIRRLTPTECERLQGFPDGWTSCGIIDGEKTEISDTQRYKCLGNAVTTTVVKAFMDKILPIAG